MHQAVHLRAHLAAALRGRPGDGDPLARGRADAGRRRRECGSRAGARRAAAATGWRSASTSERGAVGSRRRRRGRWGSSPSRDARVGVGRRARRVIRDLPPDPAVMVVAPRSAHNSILPHRVRWRACRRPVWLRRLRGQALLMAMDSVDTEASAADEPGGGADGRRRAGARGDHRVQRQTPSASTSARASRTPPPPRIDSWPTCPAIRAGSGPSSWPPTRRGPRHDQRSRVGAGPDGAAGAAVGAVEGARQARRPGPRRSAGARPPTTPGWCPATWPAVTRKSTRSPSRSGSAAVRCSANWAAATPRNAGTTATTARSRRWRGRPGACAATAASTLPLAGALGTMFGVCANELAADGHVVESEYGCGAHSDTPQPPGTGSPLYDPFDDGVLDVVEPEN